MKSNNLILRHRMQPVKIVYMNSIYLINNKPVNAKKKLLAVRRQPSRLLRALQGFLQPLNEHKRR